MKRIEMLTDVRDAGLQYFKGEIRIVTPEKAGYFCGLGWARDLAGDVQTGTPDTSEKTLEVQSVRHVIAASTVGS